MFVHTGVCNDDESVNLKQFNTSIWINYQHCEENYASFITSFAKSELFIFHQEMYANQAVVQMILRKEQCVRK